MVPGVTAPHQHRTGTLQLKGGTCCFLQPRRATRSGYTGHRPEPATAADDARRRCGLAPSQVPAPGNDSRAHEHAFLAPLRLPLSSRPRRRLRQPLHAFPRAREAKVVERHGERESKLLKRLLGIKEQLDMAHGRVSGAPEGMFQGQKFGGPRESEIVNAVFLLWEASDGLLEILLSAYERSEATTVGDPRSARGVGATSAEPPRESSRSGWSQEIAHRGKSRTASCSAATYGRNERCLRETF